ncbi:hypothetical protein AB4229_15855 [Vibrio breoganii]
MIKRLQIVLTLIITLGVTPQVALARPSIDIEGLSDESATNLDYYIESVGEPVAFNFTQSKWRSIVSEALTPLGSVFFKVVVIICLLIKQLLFLDLSERHQQVHSF